jgi:hypothetical protein
MILPHPMLEVMIDKAEIDFIADREGYTKFIPYTFVAHLIYAVSFYKVKRSQYECIQERNDYTIMFKKVLELINWKDVKTDNPIVFAIRVLQIMSKKTDLRNLELQATTGMHFDIEEQTECQNYKFDLKSLSNTQLIALELDDKDLNTVELSEDIQKLLLFYDGMAVLKQPVDSEYNLVKKQISSFGDFHKVRQYRFALPTFNIDLGMKKLQITKVDTTEVLTSEVILAIDYSFSMSDTLLSKEMIRSVLLYYIKQFEEDSNLSMSVVRLVGEIDSIQQITTKEELQSLFKTVPKFVLPVKSSGSIFQDLNRTYPGRAVIFLSDGKIILKEPIKLKFKLYSIVLSPNEMLKQMSLLSGGQFIILQ